MIDALVLLGLSGGFLLVAPRILTPLTRSGRRPILGVAAWQLSSWAALVGLLLAAGFALRPGLELYVQLPTSLHECFAVFRGLTRDGHPGWLRVIALFVIVAITFRLARSAISNVVVTHRRRSRHRVLLALVGQRDASISAHVLAGDVPLVYCIPGQGGCVVFTTAAIARLSDDQRVAVLAHEHAHLAGRHHLLVTSAAILSKAFPGISVCAQARQQTERLIEMRADDVAAHRHGHRAVAEALLSLADVAGPPGALGASGVDTLARIERLAAPGGMHWARKLAADGALALAILAILLSPVALAIASHAVVCLL